MRTVYCKKYHRDHGRSDPGERRSEAMAKSRCPGWLADPDVRQTLIDEAIEDPDGGLDAFGRPKRLWNAVDGWTFVGVSTNEQEARYNCYPEVPATALADELARRLPRTLDEVTTAGTQ